MSIKSERRAVVRAGYRRLLGKPSAWQAHKVRSCDNSCYYCKHIRLGLVSAVKKAATDAASRVIQINPRLLGRLVMSKLRPSMFRRAHTT